MANEVQDRNDEKEDDETNMMRKKVKKHKKKIAKRKQKINGDRNIRRERTIRDVGLKKTTKRYGCEMEEECGRRRIPNRRRMRRSRRQRRNITSRMRNRRSTS